ncbi:MAG: ABC transporter substrate-binding protein [Candidatus Omnitrophica bacterium]|nr:ABC transporter substrate-binding protein [Candidatus Omnitrophota bacterium]
MRIISLAPSITETIFVLGYGDKLVGVTEFCNWPPEAKLIDKIGGFSTPDIKRIVSLNPDLVLATDFHLKIVNYLKERGVNTYVIEAKTILDAPQSIIQIGKAINCKDGAVKLAKELKNEMDALLEKIKRIPKKVRVCYLCDIFCVAWRSCTMSKLIEALGGINIGRNIKSNQREFVLKEIAKEDPEVIITAKGHRESVDLLSFVKETPYFKKTKASKDNRIYQIQAELVCRPAPRAMIGLRKLVKFIHPEIF